MKVRFNRWNCVTLWGSYAAGLGIALRLVADGSQAEDDPIDLGEGQPIATASVNVPGYTPDPDCIAIKGWSENEGMAAALVAAGVVEEPHLKIPTGRAYAEVARLTPAARAEILAKAQGSDLRAATQAAREQRA